MPLRLVGRREDLVPAFHEAKRRAPCSSQARDLSRIGPCCCAPESQGCAGWDRGGDRPIAEKRAQAASQRVRDLVENYIERRVSTKRTRDEIARRLRKNVTEVIGDLKLSTLHRRDITKCIDAVKDRGAVTEANRLFEDCRAMMRWARGRGDLDENLLEGMQRPSEPAVRERVLRLTKSAPFG